MERKTYITPQVAVKKIVIEQGFATSATPLPDFNNGGGWND